VSGERIQESPQTIFDRELAAGRLAYQRCEDCGAAVFYPRVLCPTCASTELRWSQSEGTGVLYSATTVRSRKGDYSVALIDLDEGFRMMSRVEDTGSPIAIGDRVRARLEPGLTLGELSFAPETGKEA
jgi:uncharacterized OB-fold protein